MTVLVTPTTVVPRCREHGSFPAPPPDRPDGATEG
jgi:hypothetical protein